MGTGRRIAIVVAFAGAIVGASGVASAHPGATVELQRLSSQVQATPDDVALRLRRAAAFRRAGHLHDALQDLRVVARLRPDDRTLRLERALVFAAQGKRRAATRELDDFLATGDGTVTAHATRAELAEADGRLAQARADYDAAIAIGATPELYLARAEVDVARGDLDAAVTGLEAGCDGERPPAVVLLRRIELERARGRPARALVQLDRLLEQAPNRADWVLQRAEILAELGRDDEALAARLCALAWADAAVLRRSSTHHHLTRARVYLALARPDAARRDLQWVVDHGPPSAEAEALLAEASEAPP